MTLALRKANRFMLTSWLSARRTPDICQTKDGTIMSIAHMKDSHLMATINMIKRTGKNPQKLEELTDELKWRMANEPTNSPESNSDSAGDCSACRDEGHKCNGCRAFDAGTTPSSYVLDWEERDMDEDA